MNTNGKFLKKVVFNTKVALVVTDAFATAFNVRYVVML
jgi:hypothetical protein